MLNLDLGFILWNLCVNVWNKVWGVGVSNEGLRSGLGAWVLKHDFEDGLGFGR